MACRARATSRRSALPLLAEGRQRDHPARGVNVVDHPAGGSLAGEPQFAQAAAERPGGRHPQLRPGLGEPVERAVGHRLVLALERRVPGLDLGISTVQRGLPTGRVSHEHYIAFTRYASDRILDRREDCGLTVLMETASGAESGLQPAPRERLLDGASAHVPIAHVAFTRHEAK
jgi:hypothetical protein